MPPTAAVDHMGGALPAWFGLSSTAVVDIISNLTDFGPAQRDRGYMPA